MWWMQLGYRLWVCATRIRGVRSSDGVYVTPKGQDRKNLSWRHKRSRKYQYFCGYFCNFWAFCAFGRRSCCLLLTAMAIHKTEKTIRGRRCLSSWRWCLCKSGGKDHKQFGNRFFSECRISQRFWTRGSLIAKNPAEAREKRTHRFTIQRRPLARICTEQGMFSVSMVRSKRERRRQFPFRNRSIPFVIHSYFENGCHSQ